MVDDGVQVPRVTLSDVARRAFVSISTASAAIAGRGGVSEVTRESVLQAAQELGYRPSGMARGLRGAHQPIVGIVTDPTLFEGQSDSPQVFVRTLLTQLSQELLASGALPMSLQAHSPSAPVDCLLVLDVGPEARAPRWLNVRTPLVVAGIAPLHVPAPVRLAHDLPAMTSRVLTCLSPRPNDRVALLVPSGRMRHLEAFRTSYLHWCVQSGRTPLVLPFEPVPEQAQWAGEAAVQAGATGVFLPSGRCEWSVLTGIQRADAARGTTTAVIALGEGVVEAAFGPSVGYLSLEGANSAKLIASTLLAAMAGELPTPLHLDLPWRVSPPSLLTAATASNL